MTDAKINKTIAKNIHRLLDIQGKTQTDLAKYMDVSPATVSNWCNGIKVPRMDKIDKICTFFGVYRSAVMDEPGEINVHNLTNEEKAIILLYRSADPARRAIIRELLENAQRKVDE